MKKRKLKLPVLYGLYAFCFIMIMCSIYILERKNEQPKVLKPDYIETNKILPVIEEQHVIIKPFLNNEVKIGKNFYDYKSSEDEQRNSLINYQNTYLPNSGVDYIYKDKFDVVSILDGKVIKVSTDKHMGQTVEIRYKNNLIGLYQSLSDILIKEGDNVLQGQVIAKSGESNISKELNNHLHFELIKDGKNINPEKCYEKSIDEL